MGNGYVPLNITNKVDNLIYSSLRDVNSSWYFLMVCMGFLLLFKLLSSTYNHPLQSHIRNLQICQSNPQQAPNLK